MALFPVVNEMKERSEKMKSSYSRETLADLLVEYYAEHCDRYEFKIQLGTSLEHHLTEDGSVVWGEATAPYHTIAIVEYPAQDALTAARRVFWEDHMKLSSWDGLTEHRPRRIINRLGKIVDDVRRNKREEFNGIKARSVNSVNKIPW